MKTLMSMAKSPFLDAKNHELYAKNMLLGASWVLGECFGSYIYAPSKYVL